jgi:transposase-like protein
MAGGSDETAPIGRPTKYDPAYCEQVVAFLADGYSVAAFAGSIGVSRSTIYQWIDEYPAFSDAVKTGQAAAILWWEKANRNLALTGDGNPTAIIFGLKNRAADEWRDKIETEQSGTVTNIHKITREFIRPQDQA